MNVATTTIVLTGLSCFQPVTSNSSCDLTDWTIYVFANLQHLFTAFNFSADLLACPSPGPTWVNQPQLPMPTQMQVLPHHGQLAYESPRDHATQHVPNVGAFPLVLLQQEKPHLEMV